MIVNNTVALGDALPIEGNFDTIRRGLRSQGTYNAKIYAVKAGVLAPTSVPDEPAAGVASGEKPEPKREVAEEKLAGILETFEKAKEGQLPSGWLPGNHNTAVTKVGERAGLELNDPTAIDQVTLPKQALKGRFLLDCDFEMTDRNSALQFRLEGPNARPMLLVGIKGYGQIVVQDKPRKDISRELKVDGTVNKLTLERTAIGYVVRLNGAQLTFPPAVASGPFESVKLTLGPFVKTKNNRSPVVRSVKLTPME